MISYKKNYENYLNELYRQTKFLAEFQITCIEKAKPGREEESTLRHINQSLLDLRKKVKKTLIHFRKES